jgi:DNA-binding MurR/RpiR family transcriptional regulator
MAEVLVGELVRQRMGRLSPAEKRLARVLLASYPIAGLESLARLAERAGVSSPTATRFISKLGLGGYPDFQAALRAEVQARLSSPLARYEREPAWHEGSAVLGAAFDAFQETLRTTHGLLSEEDFEAVADVLADLRRRIFMLGGRMSAQLARYLAAQLHLLRPGVVLLESDRSTPADHLIDLTKRDVLVVFDYRRYQTDTIRIAREAAARRGTVVLLTDPWLSPAAASATYVLVSSVHTVAPFDSMVGALGVVEALVAAVLGRLGEQAHVRMRRLDELRDGVIWHKEP